MFIDKTQKAFKQGNPKWPPTMERWHEFRVWNQLGQKWVLTVWIKLLSVIHQINTNECLPLESEEEENVVSESEIAAMELKGLSVRNWSEMVLPRMMVVIRRSSDRVLAAESAVASGEWVWEKRERDGITKKKREWVMSEWWFSMSTNAAPGIGNSWHLLLFFIYNVIEAELISYMCKIWISKWTLTAAKLKLSRLLSLGFWKSSMHCEPLY